MTAMMRTVVMTEPGGPDAMRLETVPIPDPQSSEVRIKVRAASVNPVDISTRRGIFHGRWFEGTPRLGLGWDVAGVVDATGDETDWQVGLPVLAMNDNFSRPSGCYAEYVTVPASAVARCPAELELVTASTLPLNATTADQGLVLLDLPAGSRVLVTGAAGAVGGFAVSLAATRGLRAVGLAAAADEDLVRSFGAETFVPRTIDFSDLQVDGVLDAAMLGDAALSAVRDRGRFVAVSPPMAPSPKRGISVRTVMSEPIGARLEELASLAVQGVLHPRVAGTLTLDQAPEAHRRTEAGGTRARWVLVP